ncbi:MAG: hypothetical protein AAGA25_14535 [Planctomycetota bacterium]
MNYLKQILASAACISLYAAPAFPAIQSIELAGDDHTGYLSASNVKNWGSEAAALAGLPNYAYFEISPGGLWTSIVAEPLSAASIYAEESVPGVTVLNKSVTESDFATVSSGTIDYDDVGLTGTGTEVLGVSDISVTVDAAVFSPRNSPNNSGSGVGNAGWTYAISASGLAGTGLTFVDGALESADFTADISIELILDGGAFGPLAFADTYDGTLTVSGDQFSFDVDVIQGNTAPFLEPFTDTRIVFNRSGSIAAIPEPGSGIAIIGLSWLLMKRKNGKS